MKRRMLDDDDVRCPEIRAQYIDVDRACVNGQRSTFNADVDGTMRESRR